MKKLSIGGPALALLTALAAGLLFASPAAAAAPTGGTTTLKLGGPTAGLFALAGVNVKAVAPAKKRSSGLTFPISGGQVSPANLRGTIRHRGAIKFSLGGRSITLRSLRVKLATKGASLSATIGGRRVSFATLSISKAIVHATSPASVSVSNITAKLSSKGARAINRQIGTSLFEPGFKLGTVSAKVTIGSLALSGGSTVLTPGPEVSAVLSAFGVTLAPTGKATTTANGFGFPITGGKVNARTLAGTIQHAGSGIVASSGGASLSATDFAIVIDATPALSALIGGSRVEFLALDLSSVQISTTSVGLVAANIAATLTDAAALALNQAFGTTLFSSGLRLGTVSIGARTS